MPVYNGAAYVREALEDLSAQDFGDFELIVSDNGSTDATPAIVHEFARRDGRIRSFRHAQNIGAYQNYESILPHARGHCFMFAAHDDRWHPSCVARLYRALQAQPWAALACADAQIIDEHARPTGRSYPALDTCGLDVVGRVRSLISRFAWVELYGLMPTNLLRSVGTFKTFTGGDVCFILEMNLLGGITAVREPLFRYRIPTTKTTGYDYYAAFNTSTRQDARTYTALAAHLYRAVVAARLAPQTQADIRAAFIEVIGVHNREWLQAILAENHIAPQTISFDAARRFIADILDGRTAGAA
jgi:glycosyltransferase involved in cell wall biosynthesis